MLKTYVKIAIRNALRNWLTTALNVAGLSAGIAACLTIYLIVQHELTFDRYQGDGSRIYRLVSDFQFGDEDYHNPGVALPVARAVQTKFAGVDVGANFYTTEFQVVEIPRTGQAPARFRSTQDEPASAVFADSRFLSIMERQWLVGSPKTSLTSPDQVVLTEQQARIYFGEASPAIIGRTLRAEQFRDTLLLTVSGILSDLPHNSNFDFHTVVSLATLSANKKLRESMNWEEWNSTNSSSQCLLKLNPGVDPAKLAEQITTMAEKNTTDKTGKRWLRLQPLADVHFNIDYGTGNQAHKPTLYGLIAVGIFLLLLACINFINLTTAQATQRAKEIGIRKTMGSSRLHLILQFLGESLTLTLVAVAFSMVLTNLALTYLHDLIPKGVTLDLAQPYLWLFLSLTALMTTLLSGVYPGLLASRYLPVHTLRNQVGNLAGGAGLRKTLIVSQFVIAQVFIVGALLVGRQLNFLIDKDLGFRRDAIVTFSAPMKVLFAENNNRRFSLADRIRRLAGVDRVSVAQSTPISGSWTTSTMTFKGRKGSKEINIYRKQGDTDYLNLFGFKLLAGRNYVDSDTARELVINETLARQMGFRNPADALGQFLETDNKSLLPVVGIVKDFNHRSLHYAIFPTALMSQKSNTYQFNVLLRRGNAAQFDQVLAQIRVLWQQTYAGEPFEPEFFDEAVAKLYNKERNLGKLVNLFTALSIFISCLGLFGLATFIAQQRTKEIGVRKVLGASVPSLVALLSSDFLRLVLIAIVIATPIAWYAMHRWLQDFVYKIDIAWWLFALAGLLAVGIALLTVSFQSIKAALMNPVKSLRSE
ncbi:ABC transporter permease [Spirosoma koreense]